MASSRFLTLLAAPLLAAGVSVFSAGTVGAAPGTPTPMTSPITSTSTSPSPSTSPSRSQATDYPPDPPGTDTTTPPPVVPNGPDDLRIAAVTAGSVTLAWSPATPGSFPISRYEIVYYAGYYDVEWVQPVPFGATTVTLTDGIRPTWEYVFRIITFDTHGLRDLSGLISVVTPASDTAADRTPPTRPTDLQVAGTEPGRAVLTWTPSTDDVGVTGYVVSRYDRLKVESTVVATVPGPTATVPGTAGVEEYYVRARDAAGNLSGSSNQVSAPVSPTASCSISYRTSAQWGDGFVADLTITNSTAAAVNNWSLAFEFGGDQAIVSSWGGRTNQVDTRVWVIPESWNTVIPAGGSVTVGILGQWRTSAAPPISAQLNGFPCALS